MVTVLLLSSELLRKRPTTQEAERETDLARNSGELTASHSRFLSYFDSVGEQSSKHEAHNGSTLLQILLLCLPFLSLPRRPAKSRFIAIDLVSRCPRIALNSILRWQTLPPS